VVIFEGVLILRFSVKFYDFSFILSHSNKGIKHYAEFDKKKFKREYLADLPQVTVKLYYIEIALVLLPIINSEATVDEK
jgi:hypothetical protein